ncbi:MAG TPA: hypothetical protein VK203_03265 [Nostocaceae cyanobacterium]|nr:hypothetical protein [Nostocaceae cyanobacterium]
MNWEILLVAIAYAGVSLREAALTPSTTQGISPSHFIVDWQWKKHVASNKIFYEALYLML